MRYTIYHNEVREAIESRRLRSVGLFNTYRNVSNAYVHNIASFCDTRGRDDTSYTMYVRSLGENGLM